MILFPYEKFLELSEKDKLGESVPVKSFVIKRNVYFSPNEGPFSACANQLGQDFKFEIFTSIRLN